MNGMALTPEVEQLLVRYLQIQEEVRRLEEEKGQLRDRLAGYLAEYQSPFWCPVVAGQPLRIRVRHEIDIEYNEELLRERLGDRYAQILRPDPAKIRRNLPAVETLLQPALALVGSPHRDSVRDAIERGAVPRDAFAGAFTKVSRTNITVMRQREGDGSGAPPDDVA